MNIQRYTTMVFPQKVKGNTLHVNIVLIPKNYNPFNPFNLGVPNGNNLTPFADLNPKFKFKWLKKTDEWPVYNPSNTEFIQLNHQIDYSVSERKKDILEGIRKDFGDKINVDISSDFAETARDVNMTVNKYLPQSYRNAFNFNSPKIKNAKIDDSYHCVMKSAVEKATDWPKEDTISWGQVFAHILRQPMLAQACGFIYPATIELDSQAKKGGYLFCEIDDPAYQSIQDYSFTHSEQPFIKSYAARIPKITEDRPLFAPVLFPVMFESPVHPNEIPIGNWDQVFAEANLYNDGFAKIVHANQPVSLHILQEENDGTHPAEEAGIRLAWDDEQILEWYVRQLAKAPGHEERMDAPIGTYGYAIDVRKNDTKWQSLNEVITKAVYQIGGVSLNNKVNETIELPYQVFPTQPSPQADSPFWLPMYFTQWTGKNMVLKDTDAIEIFNHQNAVEPNNQFNPAPLSFPLLYGEEYEFRVRLKDISGGGPTVNDEAINIAAAPTAKWHFRRFLNPNLCRIELPTRMKNNQSIYFNETNSGYEKNPVLKVQRPLLPYPAVVFTNKYPDAIQRLKALAQTKTDNKAPALADPDVNYLNIRVYAESLGLDHAYGESKTDNYILLYETKRKFATDDLDKALNIPIQFLDIPVLSFGNAINPLNRTDLLLAQIHEMKELPLPTARNIRIKVAGICEGDETYFGNISEDRYFDSRYGKEHQFDFYHPSFIESDLLQPLPLIQPLQGIYLQPDEYPEGFKKVYDFASDFNIPTIVERFAQQLHLNHNGLTIMGRKGNRVIFGCSERIRHHLAPDHSSITFGSKSDLQKHWLVVTAYKLNRDWTWQGNEEISFTVSRSKRFWRDNDSYLTNEKVGEISLKSTASYESLQEDEFGVVNRSSTTIIFIDAIEPKKDGFTSNPYPDEIFAEYNIIPHLKPNHGVIDQVFKTSLRLPCTVPPIQMPEVISVGTAFSKYQKNEKYSATSPRQRHIWVELKEPIENPYDTLFCRVLTYSPDQLLSQGMPSVGDYTTDPPLPIDPEFIRIVTPHHTNDMAGFNAMQPMEAAADGSRRFFLMPIPPGLTVESPELFGFFRYEFRIGHAIWSNPENFEDQLWCTAQGRFGRAIVVNGLQHPAPTLICQTDRNKDGLTVVAPYAESVYKGKKLNPFPPRTSLFTVLYAQVPQADGQGYRNILLGDRLMKLKRPKVYRPIPNTRPVTHVSNLYNYMESSTATAEVMVGMVSMNDQVTNFKEHLTAEVYKELETVSKLKKRGDTIKISENLARELVLVKDKFTQVEPAPQATVPKLVTAATMKVGLELAIQKNASPTATITFTSDEIRQLLFKNGLPGDAPLSVVTVEVFGDITNVFDLMGITLEDMKMMSPNYVNEYQKIMSKKKSIDDALNTSLGQFRILRTSPLTEVPAVCCETCKEI